VNANKLLLSLLLLPVQGQGRASGGDATPTMQPAPSPAGLASGGGSFQLDLREGEDAGSGGLPPIRTEPQGLDPDAFAHGELPAAQHCTVLWCTVFAVVHCAAAPQPAHSSLCPSTAAPSAAWAEFAAALVVGCGGAALRTGLVDQAFPPCLLRALPD
jgi:hypothetical protein